MNIAGFYEESSNNGFGFRSVLFVSGCPHHCKGCQNPETWNEGFGIPFDKDYYLDKIKNNPIVKGVTLSGGDPLTSDHIKELLPFVKEVVAMGKNIWAYSGYTFEQLESRKDDSWDSIKGYIDYLVDGEFKEELKDLDGDILFRGSFNQRIIDVKVTLKYNCVVEYDENSLKI